jgi:hypothetical protein
MSTKTFADYIRKTGEESMETMNTIRRTQQAIESRMTEQSRAVAHLDGLRRSQEKAYDPNRTLDIEQVEEGLELHDPADDQRLWDTLERNQKHHTQLTEERQQRADSYQQDLIHASRQRVAVAMRQMSIGNGDDKRTIQAIFPNGKRDQYSVSTLSDLHFGVESDEKIPRDYILTARPNEHGQTLKDIPAARSTVFVHAKCEECHGPMVS